MEPTNIMAFSANKQHNQTQMKLELGHDSSVEKQSPLLLTPPTKMIMPATLSSHFLISFHTSKSPLKRTNIFLAILCLLIQLLFFCYSSLATLELGLFFVNFHKMNSNLGDNAENHEKQKPLLKLLDSSLRLSVIPLSIVSIWLTLTNQQESSIYGKIKSTNLLGLKYMVCINAVCAGYACVAVVALWTRFLVNKAWLFFVSDQIMAYLVVTSGAAAMEIVYLAYKGDQDVTWSEACTSYGKFCSRMKLALILHAFVLLCFIILALTSAYRAFSLFDPPHMSSDELQDERT